MALALTINHGLLKSVTSHYNWLEQSDYPDYAGYTKGGMVRSDGKTGYGNNNNGTFGNNDVTVDFYYNAKQYPLTFYNYDGTQISTQQVTLNADISSYLTSNIPAAPMEGATWKGWFTDPEHGEGTEYTGGNKMPAGLVLYGDFAFPMRTVTFDSQGGTAVPSQTDEYGFYAEMPTNPTREHYSFQGWFPAGDNVAPYDFNQPVEEDITLYAHWAQDTIGYTVHYYEKGTTTPVLNDKVVSDPNFKEGDSITETAPVVAGHVSDKSSATINLSFDEENNTIIFYYDTIPDEIIYTVNYVLKDHPDIKVAESKTVTVDGSVTSVTEMAADANSAYIKTQTSDPDITGKSYRPVDSTKELQLALEDNVITFEYVPYTTSKITVNYLDMDGNTIEPSDTTYIEAGDTFTVQNKAPDNFVYHHAYLHGTTTAPQPTYRIDAETGDLEIDIYYQKKLIIIANNKAKTYDGTALLSSFDNTADYTVRGLSRGDTLTSLTFDGSQTDAGTSATTPKDAAITLGTTGVTAPGEYYNIIYVPGSLTVKPVSVYISVSADQWNTHSGGSGPNYYTGQPFNVGFTNTSKQHFNDGGGSAYVSITSGQRSLFKAKYGDAIWAALYGTNGALISEKDAGYYVVTGAEQRALIAGVTVGGQQMMADPNYSITINARDSFLKIDPLPLVITTPSAEKVYDGAELTKSEGATLAHSYWTQNIGGTWTAAPAAGPGEITLGTGETITFGVNGSQTEAGESDNAYSIDWGSANSGNYKITENLGTLTVAEATLKVAVKDISKVYSGAEQEGRPFVATITGTGATIATDDYTVEGLAKSDVLTITYTPAKGTDVGMYAGSFAATYTIENAQGQDVAKCYGTKQFNAGKLTITPRTVTLTSGSGTKPYDGTALTNGTVTVGGDGFVSGEGATYNVTGSQTEVGSSKNTFTYTLNEGTKADNYEIATSFGTLEVTQSTKAVVITSSTKSWEYDGETHTDEVYTVTYDGAAATPDATGKVFTLSTGDTVTITPTAAGVKYVSDTAANNNTYTYVLTHASQYKNVSATYGTLSITKAPLTITADSAEKEYDGKPLTDNGWQDTAPVGLKGSDAVASVTVTGAITNVGTENNVPSAAVVKNGEADVTANYEINPPLHCVGLNPCG